MRKYLFLLIALLFLASLFLSTAAHAQFVNVSGTVIDVNGLHYSNGTIQAQIIPLGISPTINNLPFTGFVSGSLDINGSFSINLADNNVVKPAGTQWQITISGTAGIPPWIGLGTQTFVKIVTITAGGGACVVVGSLPCDISSTLNPAPQLARIFSGPGGGITCSPGPCNSNYLALFNNNTTVTDSLCAIFNGVLVCATPMDVQNNGYGIEKLNSASGTACGLSVSFDSAGNAITTPDGATVGSEGVAVTLQPGTNASGQSVGCGTSGNVFIGQLGSFSLAFDNQTVIRDYVTIGANGQFHDAGATQPTGVQVIGRITSLNAGTGTNATADIFTGDTVGNNASKGGKGTLCEINGVNAPGQDCNFNDTVPAAGSNKINVRWQTDNGNPDTNVSAEIDVAQAAIPGALELNTDLGGTYTAPQVVGFHAHPYTETSLTAKDVICAISTVAYQNCKPGVIPRLLSASDAVASTDRGGWLIAGGTTTALAVGTAASLSDSNFYFNATANGSGSLTLTFSGGETVTKNAASATTSGTLVVSAGTSCNLTSDNSGTANWYATCNSSVPTSTQTKRMAFPMADNNAGTCSPSWDLPASSAAVLTPKTDGTNGTVQCTLAYADGQIAYQTALPAVPADWQSWATATITFTTSDTTNGHTISFALALACVNPNAGLTDTPAYGADNAFATVTIGGGAVANATYQAQTGNLTGGSCAAGTLPHFRLKRLTDTATDSAVAVTGAIEIDYIGNGAGGAAPGTVSSVFGRTGPVVAANGDYSFANLSGLLGCGQLPAFTGDITNSACAMTIANTGVSAGSCGDTTHSCSLTINAKGQISAQSNNVIAGGSSGGTITIANEGTTGTVVNGLVSLTGAPSKAIRTGLGLTGGIVGICTANCTTTGNATITTSGIVPCVFDGATTSNDYVSISAGTNDNCHDAGTTPAFVNGDIVGRVLSTNGAGGTFNIDLWSHEISTNVSQMIFTTPTQSPANSAPVATITQSGSGFSCCAWWKYVANTGHIVNEVDQNWSLILGHDKNNSEYQSLGWIMTAPGTTNCASKVNGAFSTTSMATSDKWGYVGCGYNMDQTALVPHGLVSMPINGSSITAGDYVQQGTLGAGQITSAGINFPFVGDIVGRAMETWGSGFGSVCSMCVPVRGGAFGLYTNDQTAQTAAITDTTMFTVGATAALFRLTGTINCTTTSAAAVAQLNIKYTDTGSTAQTVSVSDTCTSLVTTGIPNLVIALRAKASTTITYGVTITNTPTYDVSVRLESMGGNP